MDYLDGITIQTILDQKHELEEKHRLAAEEILNRVKVRVSHKICGFVTFLYCILYIEQKASQKLS